MSNVLEFRKATKKEAKLRLALIGGAGCGKTYTALSIASHLGSNIAVIDTEKGSASKYADIFEFAVIEPETFSPATYVECIYAAVRAGFDVLIIDSLSHAWIGKGGALEMKEEAERRMKNPNGFTAWRDVTPEHNKMIDAIVSARLHIIATLRSKMEYVSEKDERGKTVIRKVGLQPIQRDGLEYEFDVVCDLDAENNLIVGKTRCPQLSGKSFHQAGKDVAEILQEWLTGEPDTDAKMKRAELEAEIESLCTELNNAPDSVVWDSAKVDEFVRGLKSFNPAQKLSDLTNKQTEKLVLLLRERLHKLSERKAVNQ